MANSLFGGDMVQEITTTSWGRRIINALWGVLFGFAFLVGAFFLVFWNEGNSLHTRQSLEQTEKVTISIPNAPIDPKNELRVVYLSGLATTEDILSDKLLKIAEKAIQLKRQVDMYQWKEETETKTEKIIGGSEQEVKTYHYKKEWSSKLIDSGEFKEQAGHENPASMPIHSETQYANKVTVGDFDLPLDLIKQINGGQTVNLDKSNLEELKKIFNNPVHLQGDILYVGNNEQTPKVGDLRISVTAVYPTTVSIIAQQTGNTLQPYLAPAGHAVSLIEMGQMSPQEMTHNAEVKNSIMTWFLRLVSLVLMIMGLAMIMSPIAVLADFVPFFGDLVGFGTGFIAFSVGLCLWIVAMAIAWFVVRPLLSIGLIAFALISCSLFFFYRKKRGIKS